MIDDPVNFLCVHLCGNRLASVPLSFFLGRTQVRSPEWSFLTICRIRVSLKVISCFSPGRGTTNRDVEKDVSLEPMTLFEWSRGISGKRYLSGGFSQDLELVKRSLLVHQDGQWLLLSASFIKFVYRTLVDQAVICPRPRNHWTAHRRH